MDVRPEPLTFQKKRPMKSRFLLLCLALTGSVAAQAASTPVRALLITGGCCHDYDFQAKSLTEGIQKYGAVT